MIPDAKAILLLVRLANDEDAAYLIEQYALEIATRAVYEAVGQAYDHALAMMTAPAERGTLQ